MTTAASTIGARKNFLLASLPDDEFRRVVGRLEPVSLALGKVLYESGDRLDYVYFPTTAIVSLLYIMENGATAEIGVVGNDGITRGRRREKAKAPVGSCVPPTARPLGKAPGALRSWEIQ